MAVCDMIITYKSQLTKKNMAVCQMITTYKSQLTKKHGCMSNDYYL